MKEDTAHNYDGPKQLGFMRIVQIALALNIASTLIYLALYIQKDFYMNANQLLGIIGLIYAGIAFWMILKRKKMARWLIIGYCSFNLAITIIYNLVTSTQDLPIIVALLDIIQIIYFSTSYRAKTLLTQPISFKPENNKNHKTAQHNLMKKWPFWRNIIIYFCLFSVVGHFVEIIYTAPIHFGIIPGASDIGSAIWQQPLYPFSVYGIGAVACILLLHPVKHLLQKKLKSNFIALLISFICNSLVCTSIELVSGLIFNQPLADGSLPLWDYSDMPCNFMGQICMQNAIAFGVISTLMVWAIYPFMKKLFEKIPRDIMDIIFIVLIIWYLIGTFLY